MPPYVAITQAEPDLKVIEFILDFWDECMTKHILSHTTSELLKLVGEPSEVRKLNPLVKALYMEKLKKSMLTMRI